MAQSHEALRIDPMLLVALQEARHVADTLDLFPGWDFSEAPVLLYRPGVQDVLLNMSHPPEGFVRYEGPHPLGDEGIYIRNDSTHFDIDGQNTVIELEGQWVLVVADAASQMRNQLRTLTRMTAEQQAEWLANWSFLFSPYDALTTMLHEGFHAYQYRNADKFADESVIARYPLLDVENNALHQLEGHILRTGVTTTSEAERREALRQFAAVRAARHARLAPRFVDYELRNEFTEGLAKYIEYAFYQQGRMLQPRPDMYLASGFHGYGEQLDIKFAEELDFAERMIAGEIAVNNNPFGAGGLRFKLYPLGALQALLLDEVSPGWQTRIFDPEVYQTTLLLEAAGLSSREQGAALEAAKARYGYADILASKEAFRKDGEVAARAQLEALLNTEDTLVRIDYSRHAESLSGMGFTPFGITQIDSTRAIYDMVPISVVFSQAARLQLRHVTPVLVDEETREVIFAVPTPVDAFPKGPHKAVLQDAFSLEETPMQIHVSGNVVQILLEANPER